MYKWYADAQVCYAYISDFTNYGLDKLADGMAKASDPVPTDPEQLGRYYAALNFGRSKWFTRGWTLQELIAPKDVQFFDVNWTFIAHRSELTRTISDITNIDVSILDGTRRITTVSIAKRMSWAAKRETTRVEDQAVSPLIIDV